MADISNTMKIALIFIFTFLINSSLACSESSEQNPHYRKQPTFKTEGFHTRVLERIDNQATDIVDFLAEIDNDDTYKQYALSQDELDQVATHLDTLPDPLKSAFIKIVRITFVENFSHTGIILPLGDSGYFVMALNPMILKEDINEFLSRKENSYHKKGESYVIKIRCDKNISGITAILLHELTHVMDYLEQIENDGVVNCDILCSTLHKTSPNDLWASFGTMQDNPLQQYDIRFYRPDPPHFEFDEIIRVYHHLRDSPYPTLYATTNQAEDFAELIFLYFLHSHYEADVKIEIDKDGKLIDSFSLIHRDKIKERFSYYEKL